MKPFFALFMALAFLPHPAIARDPAVIDPIDDVPDFIEKPATADIIQQLRGGGYVLFMRHGNSDISHTDRLPKVDLNDCSTQRPLTKEGRKIAAYVGNEIRKAGIPLGEIISSPMCRAKDSALAAFGPNFTVDYLLMYTSNMSDKEKAPVLEMTRELLSRPVQGKVNRVLVAHAPNLMDIFGYFPKPEGIIVVIKPMGGKNFKYIASIAPAQWKSIRH